MKRGTRANAGLGLMATVKTPSLLAAAGAAILLALAACDPSDGSGDGGSSTSGATTGDPDTTTGAGPSSGTETSSGSSSTTFPSTGASSTGPAPGTGSSTTDASTSSGGSDSSSSTGGEPADCVDEDIGSAIGDEVATGTNIGQGDDFQLRFCFGDWGGSGGATTGIGGTDTFGGSDTVGGTSFGGTDTFGETGVFTTGVGTTGEWDPDGDDYVIEWTAPESGLYVIDTIGSPMDTVLSITPPRCGASARICNDDCQNLESAVLYDATEGETVYIVIEGYAGRDGAFVLNIAQSSDLECGYYDTDTEGGVTTSVPTATAGG